MDHRNLLTTDSRQLGRALAEYAIFAEKWAAAKQADSPPLVKDPLASMAKPQMPFGKTLAPGSPTAAPPEGLGSTLGRIGGELLTPNSAMRQGANQLVGQGIKNTVMPFVQPTIDAGIEQGTNRITNNINTQIGGDPSKTVAENLTALQQQHQDQLKHDAVWQLGGNRDDTVAEASRKMYERNTNGVIDAGLKRFGLPPGTTFQDLPQHIGNWMSDKNNWPAMLAGGAGLGGLLGGVGGGLAGGGSGAGWGGGIGALLGGGLGMALPYLLPLLQRYFGKQPTTPPGAPDPEMYPEVHSENTEKAGADPSWMPRGMPGWARGPIAAVGTELTRSTPTPQTGDEWKDYARQAGTVMGTGQYGAVPTPTSATGWRDYALRVAGPMGSWNLRPGQPAANAWAGPDHLPVAPKAPPAPGVQPPPIKAGIDLNAVREALTGPDAWKYLGPAGAALGGLGGGLSGLATRKNKGRAWEDALTGALLGGGAGLAGGYAGPRLGAWWKEFNKKSPTGGPPSGPGTTNPTSVTVRGSGLTGEEDRELLNRTVRNSGEGAEGVDPQGDAWKLKLQTDPTTVQKELAENIAKERERLGGPWNRALHAPQTQIKEKFLKGLETAPLSSQARFNYGQLRDQLAARGVKPEDLKPAPITKPNDVPVTIDNTIGGHGGLARYVLPPVFGGISGVTGLAGGEKPVWAQGGDSDSKAQSMLYQVGRDFNNKLFGPDGFRLKTPGEINPPAEPTQLPTLTPPPSANATLDKLTAPVGNAVSDAASDVWTKRHAPAAPINAKIDNWFSDWWKAHQPP